MNPRVLKESGFKHLDRVIELCGSHGIYTILDLHTAPGGLNFAPYIPVHGSAVFQDKMLVGIRITEDIWRTVRSRFRVKNQLLIFSASLGPQRFSGSHNLALGKAGGAL
jgi:aryl-phospho-beta-D-glucosidase BglC (GH1 family)